MRALLCPVAVAASMMLCQAAPAQPAPATCESKRADIMRDLDEARARGQTRRARGLEKALRETRRHCSDAGLQKAHAARIAQQEKKIAERQRDLDEARARGKADKIADREAKLAREQAELERLRSATR